MAAAQGVIYVSNLPYEAHEAVVQQAFEYQQIAVNSVQLLKKGSFNRSRNSGLACVTLARRCDVEHCCDVMDGKYVFGRPIIVRKDNFESDDPAYDSTIAAAAATTATAAGTARSAQTAAVTAAAAGSAAAAVQRVKGTAAKHKQQVVAPAQGAAAVVTAAGSGSTISSRCGTASSVPFVG